MSLWVVVIGVGALALIVGVFSLVMYRLHHFAITETMVMRVVKEQVEKELVRTDLHFDERIRRIACMQRFERYAQEQKVKLPTDLAARIHAQLTILGK